MARGWLSLRLLSRYRSGDRMGDLAGVRYPLVYDCLYVYSYCGVDASSIEPRSNGVMLISGSGVKPTLSGANLRPGL